MAVSIDKTGKTVQQAINDALAELGLSVDEVVIEVLDEGESGGLLGMGRRPAKVRITSEGKADLAASQEPAEYFADEEEYAGEPETPEEAETSAYVATILSGIGIHGKISSYREGDTLHIEVSGQDCGAAIGRHGETLEAIQYLASLVANKYTEERIRVYLDIGGYRQRRESTLISLAERAADKVVQSGLRYSLDPMSPSERRIIHSALQEFPGVTTFSEGEEPERHVVISPSLGP